MNFTEEKKKLIIETHKFGSQNWSLNLVDDISVLCGSTKRKTKSCNASTDQTQPKTVT